MKQKIHIQTEINAPKEKVWECFTEPAHIVNWNYATPEWHTPKAENNLVVGGSFSYRMEARDGSMGFDFGGKYLEIKPLEKIVYELGDGRTTEVLFRTNEGKTVVEELFEAEDSNSAELQKQGWQTILDNFKLYVEK